MPSKDLREAEDTLRIVIQNLIDAQEALQQIGEDTRSETLRRYFLAESLKRAEFRGELENILHREGVADVDESGTAAGAVVRAWTGLKTKLGAGDPSLLEMAAEGERSALDAYSDALEKDLPLPMKEALAMQAAHIAQAYEYVSAARDSSKAAS
jgi:uncharacterized protein (TIGR02284 family)